MRFASIDRLARPAFSLAAAGAFVLAIVPESADTARDRFGDKVEHVFAFAVLALLANLGFPAARRGLIVERLAFLGAAIEMVQSIPALNRDSDIRDWLFDIAAVVVVTLAFALARRRR
jgi:VanZ family protein